jgi:amino acid transporter
MSLIRLVLGRPLANEEQPQRKIGVLEAVPAMGLDALASSAYGPEAALTILIPLGAASLVYVRPIMLLILALLAILYISYRQTIRAYPSNGGAYTVSKENLGVSASLLAAAALMIDYVLNVAVGISAGVGALISAVPALQSYTLWLCLGILLLITVVNLRGTLESGRAFALPTYLFVASFFLMLAFGAYRAVTSGGHPQPVVPPPPLPAAGAAVSLWLLMRAFASGCTAMTGVEAVSNGVSAFREPVVKHAHRTLTVIVVLLGLLLGGIAYLVQVYQIGAMDETKPGYQSVLSQLASAVVGRGMFYYVAIGSLLCVLCLSANTSFVDFPRLCRFVARDDFLPRPFALVGRRLVFSVGITYLAVTAGLLLMVFGGITDRLIPLFAIGAFLTFTLSQAGMVVHWRRQMRQRPGEAHVHFHFAVNALGAVTTGIAFVVILAAKFTEGAWITVLVIPCVIILLRSIKRYYEELEARLREDGPLELSGMDPPVVLVTAEDWNRLTDKALKFALRVSPDVMVVHLCRLEGPDEDEKERRLRETWSRDVEQPARAAGLRPPRLVLLQARYRRVQGPLLKFITQLEAQYSGRLIAVLIPEIVKLHWWEHLLHTHRARRLRALLLRYGGSRLVVINIPWYIEEPRIEEALVEEEEATPASPSEAGTQAG